jgi:hypothetical protein
MLAISEIKAPFIVSLVKPGLQNALSTLANGEKPPRNFWDKPKPPSMLTYGCS